MPAPASHTCTSHIGTLVAVQMRLKLGVLLQLRDSHLFIKSMWLHCLDAAALLGQCPKRTHKAFLESPFPHDIPFVSALNRGVILRSVLSCGLHACTLSSM